MSTATSTESATASSPVRQRSAEWEPDLRTRADADLAERSVAGVLAYVVLWATIAFSTELGSEHPLEAWLPAGLFLMIGLWRYHLVRKFGSLHAVDAGSWRRKFFSGVMASGLLWGAACALIVWEYGLGGYALLFLLATAGIASGGLAALAPAGIWMVLYLAVLLLPSVPALLVSGHERSAGVAVMFFVYFSFLVVVGRRLHAEYWSALQNLQALENQRAELTALTQHHEALLNSVGDGIIGVDRAGTIRFVNPAGARLLGTTAAKLLGLPLSGIQSAAGDGQTLSMSSASGLKERGVFQRADQSTFPVGYTFTHVTEQNEITGAVLVFHDITARRKLELELQKAAALAEEANRGKTQFLAAMGHELRTPLNGVLGITGLLGNTELNTLQRELLAALKSSAESLLASMNSILEYTSLESGITRVQAMNFHLPGAVRATMERFYEPAGKKQIALAEDIEPSVPALLFGDASLLQQLLAKLLENAIKFSAAGRVRLRVVRVDGPGSGPSTCWLRFEVMDQGPGVAVAQHERIFEPFTQVDNSSTRTHGGLGLGLAIARRLALLQGGRIGCDNGAVSGSLFWCELPYTVAV